MMIVFFFIKMLAAGETMMLPENILDLLSSSVFCSSPLVGFYILTKQVKARVDVPVRARRKSYSISMLSFPFFCYYFCMAAALKFKFFGFVSTVS